MNSYISLSDQDNQGAVAAELLVDQERGPEQMVIEQELWEEYKKRLEQNLSKMENKVLQYYLDGNHYIQIAEIMGKSPKSIDNALQRIRQKIRQIELD